MGKDLKGKELGVGISQRKDGLYTARYTDRRGKRRQKYFSKLQECRKWISDAQFNNEHGGIDAGGEMTVSAWFEYWLTEIKGNNIRSNTRTGYQMKFDSHIKPYIGDMLLSEVKPIHCQNVLNKMAETHRTSTIREIRMCMHNLFESALDNEMIHRNPVTKFVVRQGLEIKEKKVLTLEEQRRFLDTAKKYSAYNHFAFVLQTGIRVGELSALRWSDVDFEKNIIHIRRTATYVDEHKIWEFGNPKSKSSEREIPLTKEAIGILKKQKEQQKNRDIVLLKFSDLIFTKKNGLPLHGTEYNIALRGICKRANIQRFSIHTLRHTFATRCIEAGMKYKTLQSILGHSNINITMDLYVHTTAEERLKEMENIEDMLKLV